MTTKLKIKTKEIIAEATNFIIADLKIVPFECLFLTVDIYADNDVFLKRESLVMEGQDYEKWNDDKDIFDFILKKLEMERLEE